MLLSTNAVTDLCLLVGTSVTTHTHTIYTHTHTLLDRTHTHRHTHANTHRFHTTRGKNICFDSHRVERGDGGVKGKSEKERVEEGCREGARERVQKGEVETSREKGERLHIYNQSVSIRLLGRETEGID